MSPLVRITCCLLGIAAAGVPLIFFTLPQDTPAPALEPAAEPAACAPVPALLRYTGAPSQIIIRHEGAELCRISPQEGEASWQGTLLLPPMDAGASLELELECLWSPAVDSAQAVTLELTPPHLPSARDTQWADSAQEPLHSIFSFQW